jgi:hypothetical protein
MINFGRLPKKNWRRALHFSFFVILSEVEGQKKLPFQSPPVFRAGLTQKLQLITKSQMN